MTILHDFCQYNGPGCAVALGMFDGIHKGHQALMHKAVSLAAENGLDSAVSTFDLNPMVALSLPNPPKPIFTLEENLQRIASLGVTHALVHHFTAEFAAMPPEEYIRRLAEGLKARYLVCGENYTFGKRGMGNPALLQSLAKVYGYTAVIIPPVCDSDGMISSTRIREMLATGKRERASELMSIED